jgi:hypothetical protein
MTAYRRALIASVRRATPRSRQALCWLAVLAWAVLTGTGAALLIWTVLHL